MRNEDKIHRWFRKGYTVKGIVAKGYNENLVNKIYEQRQKEIKEKTDKYSRRMANDAHLKAMIDALSQTKANVVVDILKKEKAERKAERKAEAKEAIDKIKQLVESREAAIKKESTKLLIIPSQLREDRVLTRPNDLVNHPSHYKSGGIETADFIEAKGLNFHLGNVVKYVSRAGLKEGSTKIQDLQKARWYLDRQIKLLEKQ
jgi:hypothetical protein